MNLFSCTDVCTHCQVVNFFWQNLWSITLTCMIRRNKFHLMPNPNWELIKQLLYKNKLNVKKRKQKKNPKQMKATGCECLCLRANKLQQICYWSICQSDSNSMIPRRRATISGATVDFLFFLPPLFATTGPSGLMPIISLKNKNGSCVKNLQISNRRAQRSGCLRG